MRNPFPLVLLSLVLGDPSMTALNAQSLPVKTNEQLVIPFPSPQLPVYGLPWFAENKPSLSRLPEHLKKTFRKDIWDLAQDPAGGRIRFCTDSKTLTLKAQCENASVMYHFNCIGENGFDLYVDGLYRGSTGPLGGDASINQTWQLGDKKEMKEITLYMPLYKPVKINGMVLDNGARVSPAPSYHVSHPMVFYGTSITQGGCASNPGMAYPAILSRRLNADFVNLGFSGNGFGDESLARAITEIKASAVILDYWANVTPEEFKETLPVFADILRKSMPTTPIIVIGPYYTLTEGFNHEKKDIAQIFVRQRRNRGDYNIYFVNGLKIITPRNANALVDGVHCNTLGFQLMANRLEGPLRRALGVDHHLGL